METLEQINAQLKALKIGVKVWQRGDRLWLRATLPPKPGSGKTRSYQQGIALGIYANPAGLKRAKAEALTVGGLLACKQFSWEPYLKEEAATSKTAAEWVREFEADYFAARDRKPITWKKDYQQVFNQLDPVAELTGELIVQTILTTKPDTRTRKRFCMALGQLAKFAGVEVNVSRLAGSYSSSKSTKPRDLPEDELIIEVRNGISNPAWQWVYGVLAIYGLRPHEVFNLDLKRLATGDKVLSVLDGKTGARRVWPFPLQWWEQWKLWEIKMPSVAAESNSEYGYRVQQWFKRNIPFHAYDLRHAWAVRTLKIGLDVTLASQQMGHSVAIHTQTYHRWISEKTHQEAFEKLSKL
jgi:integrase